jgi:hypothetical protein
MRLYGIYVEYSLYTGSTEIVRSMYKADGKNCWLSNQSIVDAQARALVKSDRYNKIEIISVEVSK